MLFTVVKGENAETSDLVSLRSTSDLALPGARDSDCELVRMVRIPGIKPFDLACSEGTTVCARDPLLERLWRNRYPN